jgi:8-oxo-dGTP pyrophosphatase MutT (NUDIX family)
VADVLSRLIPKEITSEEVWKMPELLKPDQADFVLVVLFSERYIYLSERTVRIMNGLLQTPGGKVDAGETALSAAIRETEEETQVKLDPKELTYIINDPEFNCEIFVAKTIDYPEWTEPEKMTQWHPYTFKEYAKLAKEGKTTPSHTKYYKQILGRIMVINLEDEEREETPEPQETNNVGEPVPEYCPTEPIQYDDDVTEQRWDPSYHQYTAPSQDPWIQPRMEEHENPLPLQQEPWWINQPPPYYSRPVVYYTQPPMQPQLMTQPYWPEATDGR